MPALPDYLDHPAEHRVPEPVRELACQRASEKDAKSA
jgi:hypothetical protein